MNASKKYVRLAGVAMSLAGTICVGTALVSAVFSLIHLCEFTGRAPSMAAWAGVGVTLILVGGLLVGRGYLRLARAILRDDLGV